MIPTWPPPRSSCSTTSRPPRRPSPAACETASPWSRSDRTGRLGFGPPVAAGRRVIANYSPFDQGRTPEAGRRELHCGPVGLRLPRTSPSPRRAVQLAYLRRFLRPRDGRLLVPPLVGRTQEPAARRKLRFLRRVEPAV